jgi:hypothetical protein
MNRENIIIYMYTIRNTETNIVATEQKSGKKLVKITSIITTLNTLTWRHIRIIKKRVTYLKILPEDDPNMDRDM